MKGSSTEPAGKYRVPSRIGWTRNASLKFWLKRLERITVHSRPDPVTAASAATVLVLVATRQQHHPADAGAGGGGDGVRHPVGGAGKPRSGW